MRWTTYIEGGPRRVNHAAVCIGSKIYSFGGYCSTEEYKDWDPIPVHVLNTVTLRWKSLNYTKCATVVSLPFQRYGHTAVAYGDKVYMWGGRNNVVACDKLSCFDTNKLEWSTPSVSGTVPYPKDGHSACIIKNKMYIFGGFEYIFDQYSNDVHCLDLDTMQWSYINTLGTPPSHRDFHTAVAYNERMYIYGGRGDMNNPYNSDQDIYCPLVYYLDTATETWVNVSARGTWPIGRRSHSAWIYKDHMYIFGGLNAKRKKHFNDLHRYSLKGNYWEKLTVQGVGPCQRRRQACLNYKDKVYLFGGTSPCAQNNRPSNESDDSSERLIDNSDLHVLDYSPSLKTLCILAVLKYNLDQTSLPHDIIFDIMSMTLPNRISRPINQSG
ncbi:kelch domain-containing protein 3 [Bicyclus anynana]|uniref:Kelch domain-containing protein 3 n=1 Tax=Bicyclus anynana TaxID=110368 RepID=A0A6J1MPS8_BICAN|nr:kelch domain-containing protein 3 [Bicyclus anynana]